MKNIDINLQNELGGKTIGIIGLGHLGASLAAPLALSGFPKEKLLISYKGSEKTLSKAKTLGLDDRLTDTKSLMSAADIIFVACRPQDLLSLPADAVKEDALIVSCMAGLPLALLSRFFSGKVMRMMCSGPDSIADGMGIAVTWPRNGQAEAAIRLMGIELYEVGFEEELDSFTVGICIPPILLNAHRDADEVTGALLDMRKRFPVYGRLDGWIKEIMADDVAGERGECLQNVMTKGGISEAMFLRLKQGGSFAEALERGLIRGREITAEIGRAVVAESVREDVSAAEKAG